MGIFSKMKRAAKSKANAAIDKMSDPERELNLAITELEEQRQKAYKELLSYKTTAKAMQMDMDAQKEKADKWEKKAMVAVKAGEDELAKECLIEKKRAEDMFHSIRRDRDEAAGYAIELNNSRKQAELRLKMLKLRKGTLATQLATARGKKTAFSEAEELMEKFEAAGEAIEDEEIAAEVQLALDGEDQTTAELEAKLLAVSKTATAGTTDTEDELAKLKAAVAEQKAQKLLKK